MKTYILAFFFMSFFFNGCSEKKALNEPMVELEAGNNLDTFKQKIDVINSVINLPRVVMKTSIPYVKNEDVEVYVYYKDLFESSSSEIQPILQQTDTLKLLNLKQGYDMTGKPVFNFREITIQDSMAYVAMMFERSKIAAFGNLFLENGHWRPDGDFKIGKVDYY